MGIIKNVFSSLPEEFYLDQFFCGGNERQVVDGRFGLSLSR
jgi:hypothetical protein